ncbi:MAG: hypothetical protein RLZZ546_1269 [Bacteroidota bacterium]
MRQVFCTIVMAILLCTILQGQSVGIGTTTPDQSAILDLSSPSKGLLIPRVKLKVSNLKSPINNAATPVLVYNIRDTSDVKKGFYYWNDSIWVALVSDVNIANYESLDWRLHGNVAQSVHFLGTTNNSPLRLKINNNHAGFIGNNNLTIGLNSLPTTIAGISNVAFGKSALQNCTTSNRNTAIGDFALSLFNDDGGGDNTALGYNSLKNTNGNSAICNTAVGSNALLTNTVGFRNTAIGCSADVGSNNLSNATAIGYEASVNESDAMSFGNTLVTQWSFGRLNNPANQALKVGTSAGNGNGAYLTDGGAWTNTSDVHLKDDISSISGLEILNKIMLLPISKWRYKETNEYHIGPMAQKFYELFQVGLNDTSISTIDPSGVALIAIQQLKKENDDLKAKMDLLVKKVEYLMEKKETKNISDVSSLK